MILWLKTKDKNIPICIHWLEHFSLFIKRDEYETNYPQ